MRRFLFAWLSVVAPAMAAAADSAPLPPLRDRFAPPEGKLSAEAALPDESPNFQRHVIPLMGRLGCNGRSCHGSFQGQGGFRLSMFGYDFAADHQALLEDESPRVDRKDPTASLMLTKPVSDDEHGGGKRYEVGGWEYRVFRKWIAAGAENDSFRSTPDRTARLERLEVAPAEIIFSETRLEPVTLRVTSHWTDGSREDVTCITRYSTNDDGVATIDADGVVRSAGKGSTYVIVCYDSGVVSVPVMRPVSDRVGPKYPAVVTPTKVDELVVGKLRKLGIVPSEVCTDEEFLRRAQLDTCGTLPTPEEILAFIGDTSADKRRKKIDELLARPEYALWWATKLCDITGLNAPAQLGSTNFGPLVGAQWYDWIERRVRDNRGYHEIVRGMVTAVSVRPGESYEDYVTRQTSYLRKQDPVDFTDQPSMPHYWFRGNLGTSEEKALGFAYTFLGVRLDCAQCHKHPFDQWSQQDFKDFTAFFDRVSKGVHPDRAADQKKLEERLEVVKLDTAVKKRTTYWKWVAEGKIAIWPEVYIAPLEAPSGKSGTAKAKPPAKPETLRQLGGREITLRPGQDPREPILEWMLEKDNPYFARAFVNRVWAHYFGVGIVNPPDDANLGNPPSTRELLDYLAEEFVARKYDMRWLHREITSSDAYQRSWRTNDTNRNDERLFSHAVPRRLPAEVIGDALKRATAAAEERDRSDAKTLRARFIAQQAPAYERALEYSMLVFGKPIRKTNCDCERDPQPSLLQSVYLRNDADLRTLITRKDGWLAKAAADAEPADLVDEPFLRTVSRRPTAAERDRCLKYFDETKDRAETLGDVIWALLNTREFVTNH